MYARVSPVDIGTSAAEAGGSISGRPHPTDDTEDKQLQNKDTKDSSSAEKPKHVSLELWEKFKALEKRTDEATKRSTEKRVKHLKQQITDTVQREITLDEDKDILRSHDVKIGPPVVESSHRKKHRHKKETKLDLEDDRQETKQWEDVKPYLNANQHLEAGVSKPWTKLDSHIEESLAKGDYSTAEKLSDQLANREFGTKIAHAFDARDFVKRKKEEETDSSSKKKKKLNWGFEHKQRWEMKSNM